MELLIIKSAKDYIRVKDNSYHRVRLDKASVFPMNLMKQVLEHAAHLSTQGFKAVKVKKLILTEEDL